MKRIVLFAHYDRDGIIDDYVIYYLRGLRGVAQRILFVSDCQLRPRDANKLDGLAELVFAGGHGEYDFGSWKRAFAFLGDDLADWDEVVIANDSCYAPIYPFEDVFERMDALDCDFWSPSVTEIEGKLDHLSSYFLVLRRPVLSDPAFREFWPGIARQPDVETVVAKYEKGLTQLLLQRGYRWRALTPMAEVGAFLKTKYLKETLHVYRCSWLKARFVKDNPFFATNIAKFLKSTTNLYPRSLIDSHLARIVGTASPRHYYRRFIGNYKHTFGAMVTIESKINVNYRNVNGMTWWKVYFFFKKIPLFVFALPIGRRYKTRF